MSVMIPAIPPTIIAPNSSNTIRAAAPVIGNGQWQTMSYSCLFLIARLGNSLVSAGPDGHTIAPGGDRVYRFWVWPHEQALSRFWILHVAGLSVGGYTVTFEAPSGTTVLSRSIDAKATANSIWVNLQEEIPSPSSTAGEVTLRILNDSVSSGNIVLSAVTCYEVPRTIFDPTGVAPSPSTNASGTAVFAEGTSTASINAVMNASQTARSEARRSSYFTWHNTDGVVITDSSFTDILPWPAYINARHLYLNENQRAVHWAVYAKSTGGDGQVEAVGSTTSTATVTSSTGAWYTGSSDVATEDMSRIDLDGGLRSGRATLTFKAKKTTGTSVTIYAICCGES